MLVKINKEGLCFMVEGNAQITLSVGHILQSTSRKDEFSYLCVADNCFMLVGGNGQTMNSKELFFMSDAIKATGCATTWAYFNLQETADE